MTTDCIYALAIGCILAFCSGYGICHIVNVPKRDSLGRFKQK